MYLKKYQKHSFSIFLFVLLIIVVSLIFKKTYSQSSQKFIPSSDSISNEEQKIKTVPFEENKKITANQFELLIVNFEFLDEVHSATEVINPEQQFLSIVFLIKNQQKTNYFFDFRRIQLSYDGKEIHSNERATFTKNNTQSGNAIFGSFIHGEIPGYEEKTGSLLFDVPFDIDLTKLQINISI